MRLHFAAAMLLAAACGARSPHDRPPEWSATVAVDGAGRVVSAPAGIDCPGTCSGSFPAGTSVVLTATPSAQMSFAGWQGACDGTGSCTLGSTTMVRASFTPVAPPTLEVRPVAAQVADLRLNPDPMRVFVRQWVRLQAMRGPVPESRVVWTIREGGDTGTIGADGTYTAPAHAGTVHVVATSLDDPGTYGEIAVESVVAQALYDYGGAILPAPRVRLVWRGEPAEFGDAPDLFHRFLDGVNGSAWLSMLDQYLRGTKAAISRAPDLAAPAHGGDPLDPVHEVCAALSRASAAPSAGEIVVLLLPASSGAFDFHSIATCAGVDVPLVVVSLPSTAIDSEGACNGRMTPAEQMLWAFSHELSEAMTDPRPVTAWADMFDQELADDCVHPTCDTLSTGSFSLTALWSNAAGGCVP